MPSFSQPHRPEDDKNDSQSVEKDSLTLALHQKIKLHLIQLRTTEQIEWQETIQEARKAADEETHEEFCNELLDFVISREDISIKSAKLKKEADEIALSRSEGEYSDEFLLEEEIELRLLAKQYDERIARLREQAKERLPELMAEMLKAKDYSVDPVEIYTKVCRSFGVKGAERPSILGPLSETVLECIDNVDAIIQHEATADKLPDFKPRIVHLYPLICEIGEQNGFEYATSQKGIDEAQLLAFPTLQAVQDFYEEQLTNYRTTAYSEIDAFEEAGGVLELRAKLAVRTAKVFRNLIGDKVVEKYRKDSERLYPDEKLDPQVWKRFLF